MPKVSEIDPEAAAIDDTDDILARARTAYERAREWWNDNHEEAKDDLRFARLSEQWPAAIKKKREEENRPCLVYNKMPSFIRQVVNDARQNKPAIKVHPQDTKADIRTAEILNGLIRNIETSSDADVAYDTAIEHAVSQGFGYWRINTRYACDDAFDQDIVMERVSNPFTVYGDPRSTAADSSDWNEAWIVTKIPKDEFKREYPDAERTDWDADFRDCHGWVDGDEVVVAEWWTREKVRGFIVALSDGSIQKLEEFEEREEEFAALGITMVGEPRAVERYEVTQRILNGAEILSTLTWPGKYIPIVPVYGDEVVDEDGKRHFRSLIRDAKGEQQTFNYMRTTGVEMLALQPRVPYIGEEKSFSSDPNWSTANSESHPYLMVPDGAPIPQRQGLPQHFGAAYQEALTASDGMKDIIGIHAAGLGQRSNEVSGVAIRARKMEGDVSTFHFIDNLQRAIRHSGRILLDLIPKVYTTERMLRILGEDMTPQTVKISPTGEPVQEVPQLSGITYVYDITAGKYDLTVSAGPSYTSRREELISSLSGIMQSVPDSAVFLIGRLARLLDLPDAEELATEMDMLNPAKQGQGIPPELQQRIQSLESELQKSQAEAGAKDAKLADRTMEMQTELAKLKVEAFRAQTERMKATAEMAQTANYFRQQPSRDAYQM